jgi:hypothetical protein
MNAEQPKSRTAIAVEATTEMLLEAVKALDLPMSPDQRVSEESAAKLLGISHRHLKDLRRGDNTNAPVHYVLGVAGSRLSYRLSHLASWIEGGLDSQRKPSGQ